jgi:hypothetical protein
MNPVIGRQCESLTGTPSLSRHAFRGTVQHVRKDGGNNLENDGCSSGWDPHCIPVHSVRSGAALHPVPAAQSPN